MMLRRRRTHGPDRAEIDRTFAVVLSAFVFLVFIAADVRAAERIPGNPSTADFLTPVTMCPVENCHEGSGPGVS